MIKQFYSTWVKCYHSGAEWTWEHCILQPQPTSADKNISSTSNDIKRKHGNTYLCFQNCCNTIKINTIPWIMLSRPWCSLQCSLGYSKHTKIPPLIPKSIKNIITFVVDWLGRHYFLFFLNYIHMYICVCVCVCVCIYKQNKHRAVTDSITLHQSGPGSNGSEGYSTFPKSARLTAHH